MTNTKLKRRFDRLEKTPTEFSAFLGRPDGVVRVDGEANQVYVTAWDGQLLKATNKVVQAQAGLPVKVQYRSNQYLITGIAQPYAEPVYQGIPDGAQTDLQWPSPGALYIHTNQFLPGLVTPMGGLMVYVNGAELAAVIGKSYW
jgi:hypothetical protein